MNTFPSETAMLHWQYASYPVDVSQSEVAPNELVTTSLMNPDYELQSLIPAVYWEPQQQINSSPSNSLWTNEIPSPPTSFPESRTPSFSSTDNHVAHPKTEEPVSPRIKRRREQNRQSQRTFRQRQSKYIQELEENLHQQTEKCERLTKIVDELKRQQPDLVEPLLGLDNQLLSPPPEEEIDKRKDH